MHSQILYSYRKLAISPSDSVGLIILADIA